MTQTTQEGVAEKSSKLAGELMTLLAFKKDSATVEDFCDVITKYLTTFAQARERAVWEEAARLVESLKGDADWFRRRATVIGKEAG